MRLKRKISAKISASLLIYRPIQHENVLNLFLFGIWDSFLNFGIHNCSGESYAERRKQLIQESKYLGGDMEHTHLVKGLDYALLEKASTIMCILQGKDRVLLKIIVLSGWISKYTSHFS